LAAEFGVKRVEMKKRARCFGLFSRDDGLAKAQNQRELTESGVFRGNSWVFPRLYQYCCCPQVRAPCARKIDGDGATPEKVNVS